MQLLGDLLMVLTVQRGGCSCSSQLRKTGSNLTVPGEGTAHRADGHTRRRTSGQDGNQVLSWSIVERTGQSTKPGQGNEKSSSSFFLLIKHNKRVNILHHTFCIVINLWLSYLYLTPRKGKKEAC